MSEIGRLIAEVLDNPEEPSVQGRIKEQVKALTARFPLPY